MEKNEQHDTFSFSKLFLRIFTDWKIFVFSILFISAVAAIICSVLLIFVKNTRDDIQFYIGIENGIKIVTKEKEYYNFLLNANGAITTPWINTGIEFKKNQNVLIRVSGNACLAAHHMMEYSFSDSLPPYPWAGPNGLEPKDEYKFERSKDTLRVKYRIANFLPCGKIIGVISDKKNGPNVQPEPSEILDIGKEFEKKIEKSGTLYLTINDNWLNEELLKNVKAEQIELDTAVYNYIKKYNYANLWFNDNIGYFIVSIRIEK